MTLEELASVTGINNQKDLKEQLGELFFLGANSSRRRFDPSRL
ncbi:WYL domain protein [Leptospira interrogans serovar Canicola]|nr:WYL domain protein [Leptospira interrogans serovar Canicola]